MTKNVVLGFKGFIIALCIASMPVTLFYLAKVDKQVKAGIVKLTK